MFPPDAGVGDTLAIGEFRPFLYVLTAFHEEAFDHHGKDRRVALCPLRGYVFGDQELANVVLGAVGMAEINHDARREIFLHQELVSVQNVFFGKVRAGGSAAKDDVATSVTGGLDDGAHAVLRGSREPVGLTGGLHRVDGDLDVAVGGVLESDRHRKSTCEFAVGLAFGGASADGTPGDQVGNVLRNRGVEEFGGGWKFEGGDVTQKSARESQAIVDAETAVHARIVDQSFPADGGAGLFEVAAHHDQELIGVAIGQSFQATGVFQRGLRIVNGARADDDDEPRVLTGEAGLNFFAGRPDEIGSRAGQRHLFVQNGGRQKRADCAHA